MTESLAWVVGPSNEHRPSATLAHRHVRASAEGAVSQALESATDGVAFHRIAVLTRRGNGTPAGMPAG
jgi:hypothetical protein